jgi:hypothetical protein
MSVNRHIIKIPSSGATATTINIPVTMEYQNVDQGEIIDRDFVSVEVEKSINPILDYEKARFVPVDSGDNQVYAITYKLMFLPNISSENYWSDVEMDDSDIKFRKNKWKKSFLRLSFYDTPIGTNQRLISFMTLFPKLYNDDIYGLEAANLNPPLLPSTPKPASQIPIRFTLEDPITRPDGFHEAYYLYDFKDEVNFGLPKTLYMRASFNNAKNGKITNLSVTPNSLPINQLVNNLYTRYILKRTSSGYYYEIDTTHSHVTLNNAGTTDSELIINLYQIQAS